MITNRTPNKKADRAFARSAPLQLTQLLNLYFNPHPCGRPKISKSHFFTKIYCLPPKHLIYSATELTTVKKMNEDATMNKFIFHLNNNRLVIEVWYAGVRLTTRRHPWDECELSFSTKAWFDIAVDTPEQAQRVVRRLFEHGCYQSPIHTVSTTAKHVFI